jgi:hypothetical protein
MTAAPAAAGAPPAPAHSEFPGLPAAGERLERLVALLDPSFLQAIGWDGATQVLSPPPEHPQLGRQVCLVAGCGVQSSYRNGLCQTCQEPLPVQRARPGGLRRDQARPRSGPDPLLQHPDLCRGRMPAPGAQRAGQAVHHPRQPA